MIFKDIELIDVAQCGRFIRYSRKLFDPRFAEYIIYGCS